MIPRWVLVLLVVGALVWLMSDPVGMGTAINHFVVNVFTVLQRIARWN